jgi:hypothetical protein
MTASDPDTLMRIAAFEHVRRLGEVHDHLTATDLKPGVLFDGGRFPLINPQRGIFKPQQMRFLLSIKTVFPKPGGKVWYDDQREVHRQIFEGDETVDYAFMGQADAAADVSTLVDIDHGLPTVAARTDSVLRHPENSAQSMSCWNAVAPGSPSDLAKSAEVCTHRKRFNISSLRLRTKSA